MVRGKHHRVYSEDKAHFNVFLHQYFESDTQDKIDLLACIKNITGILFYSDDYTTLINLQLERLTKK